MDHGLAAEIDKCSFHVQEVNFLGYILSPEGVKMTDDSIRTILDWEPPKSVKDVQVFMGFANFYRRFIYDFSGICKPITDTLRGDPRKFVWSNTAQYAFEELKRWFTEPPILRHYDPEKESYVEADSSDFALGGVLSQRHNSVLHPVAFHSRKLTPAELNYEIYDKKMLAIVNCFKQWRHYLEGANHPITVYSDHKNLEYFTTTK